MTSPERFKEQATAIIREVSSDAMLLAKPVLKRHERTFKRWFRVILLLIAATIVIPVAMITGGLLLGPRAVEGLIATPLALLVAWSVILYFGLRRPKLPKVVATADIAALPAQTEAWLDGQRFALPTPAQLHVDRISLRLQALGPQVQGLDPKGLAAAEVRRLIGEDLPELVRGYQKVPPALQRQPLHGGPSPEQQLVEGLSTIDEAIGRLHERLAKEDLHALATQQRYLELKYKKDDKLE